MKYEEGFVIEATDSCTKVRIGRHGNCNNCGSCPGSDALILESKNPVGAKIGQRVLVQSKEENMLKAAFIVFVLPLVMTFIGALVGAWIGQKIGKNVQALEIGVGAAAFILSVLYIKYIDNSLSKNNNRQPIITEIL